MEAVSGDLTAATNPKGADQKLKSFELFLCTQSFSED